MALTDPEAPGLSKAQVGRRLGLKPRTVDSYVSRARRGEMDFPLPTEDGLWDPAEVAAYRPRPAGNHSGRPRTSIQGES